MASSESCQPNRKLFSCSFVYSRAATESIPLFQPELGFCQNNGLECGQTQDWYPNEKMVVVPGLFE